MSSTHDLLSATAAWLRAGLETGDDAVVVCGRAQNRALTDAVGDSRVVVLNQDDVYGKPVDTLNFMGDFVRRRVAAGSPCVRMVGTVCFGSTEDSWEDWQHYESLCNYALAELALWSVCVYDTRRLLPRHLATAALTHPWLRSPNGTTTASPDYSDPHDVLAIPMTRNAGPAATLHLVLTGVHELTVLRGWLREQLVRHLPSDSGTALQRRDGFVVAVNEIATNAFRHGEPPVQVHLDVEPGHLTCTVTDLGPGLSDPLVGYTAPNRQSGCISGRGLWLARHLCDRVSMVRTPEGFSIRLHLNR